MPFNGSGTFARLRSWVADAAAGINALPNLVDADTNDIAAALNNVITRDGQGKPTADIPWNGHKITGLAAPTVAGDALSIGSTPASEITAILGSVPWTAASLTASQLNTIAAVGQLFGASNLTAAQIQAIVGVGQLYGATNLTAAALNVIAGVGQLYGVNNLTASQIATILGYTPARPSIAFNVSGGGTAINGSSTVTPIATTDFVCNAGGALLVGCCTFQVPSGSPTEVFMYIDIQDLSTGGVAAQGQNQRFYITTAATGGAQVTATLAAQGLTPGHTYRGRIQAATTGAIATNAVYIELSGICA